MLHNDRSRTKPVVDDAEGDDDDHAGGCLFGNKFDMLTHDTRNARVGDAKLGGGVLVERGNFPAKTPNYQEKQTKKAHREPTPFSDLPFWWSRATVKRVCGVVSRGGRRDFQGLESGKVGVAVAITGLPSARLEDGARARGDVRTERTSARGIWKGYEDLTRGRL